MPRRASMPVSPMPACWPKPAAQTSQTCLRTLMAGKLDARAHRAVRGHDGEPLELQREKRVVDPKLRAQLSPIDRTLLHLYVGGDRCAAERLAYLNAQSSLTGIEVNERMVLSRVLAPFETLRAMLTLEADATPSDPGEHLGRELLLAWCDDPAGAERKRAMPFVVCGFKPRGRAWAKASERVAAGQIEMLAGNAPVDANIIDALAAAVDHLRLAGFPDL